MSKAPIYCAHSKPGFNLEEPCGQSNHRNVLLLNMRERERDKRAPEESKWLAILRNLSFANAFRYANFLFCALSYSNMERFPRAREKERKIKEREIVALASLT